MTGTAESTTPFTPRTSSIFAQIGNTNWDQTMPNSGLLFQVADGLVSGVSVRVTDTMPAHPDLQFMFPASPGAWQALDERNGDNVGTIAGTYELRDGTVPEPGALSLLGIGIGAISLTRRRNGVRDRHCWFPRRKYP